MATYMRYLTAALVAGLALSFTPTAPAFADEDPGVRAPRVRMPPPRVRTVVRNRTVVRTVNRVRYVPVYYTSTCGGCAQPVAPAPQPVVYQTAYTSCGGCAQPVVWQAPRYYAPRYYAAGCGSCGQQVALPYYWAVRTARYRYGHGYY